MNSKGDFKVDWVSTKVARYACENWHYAGTLPPSKVACLGAWEGGRFVGVAVFGCGVSAWLVTKYGLRRHEGVELVRVAMREHETPVTRFLSIAMRMLKVQFPALRVVVSYADPNERHDGKIYQAGNWVYEGTGSKGKPLYKAPDGKIVHNRKVTPSGYAMIFNRWARVYRIDECEGIEQVGKHRYVYPLDKEMRELVGEGVPFVSLNAEAIPFDGTPADAVKVMLPHLTNDLRKKKYRSNPNPVAGHCYVASEALRYLLGPAWQPMFIKHEEDSHWFLRHAETGEILDATASQFATPVPYSEARRQAFLTKEPSKRARILLGKIRAGSIAVDAPGDQPGEGGSTPTPALQTPLFT